MTARRILSILAFGLALFAVLYGYGVAKDARPEGEVRRLVELTRVESGSAVAEIGAGKGRMTVAMGQIVGSSGRVYSTEIEEEKLEALKAAAADEGLSNVTVLPAQVDRAGLPRSCCDAIFMSKVYHHFTKPAELTASLFESVKPGGRVAVIDFEPRWWRFWLSLPEGVPENRAGHGMPVDVLIDEMESAAFQLERQDPDWWRFPERRYCVVFRRPGRERTMP